MGDREEYKDSFDKQDEERARMQKHVDESNAKDKEGMSEKDAEFLEKMQEFEKYCYDNERHFFLMGETEVSNGRLTTYFFHNIEGRSSERKALAQTPEETINAQNFLARVCSALIRHIPHFLTFIDSVRKDRKNTIGGLPKR